jgi:hypothetical protein
MSSLCKNVSKMFSTSTLKNIKHSSLPSCSKCAHNVPNQHFNYYSLDDNRYVLSRCRKFAYKDYVTGYIVHEYARSCRDDPKKCGLKAKHFQLNEIVKVK